MFKGAFSSAWPQPHVGHSPSSWQRLGSATAPAVAQRSLCKLHSRHPEEEQRRAHSCGHACSVLASLV